MSVWMIIIIFMTGALISLCSVLLGAYLMYKGKSSQPNEPFIGSPKGEVFSIQDTDAPEFTGEPGPEEERILEKTNKFLKSLGG